MANNQLATSNGDMATLKNYMKRLQPSIAAVLPKHMTAERMIKIVQVAASTNNALLKCSLSSIASCVVTSSQMGLEPNTPLHHAYIIPYGTTATLIIGYQGLIELARRSGNISKIEAVAVHEGDVFKYTRGLHPDIIHEPNMELPPKPYLKAVYAVATLTDGSQQFEVMSRAEAEAIRGRSKAGKNGPWVTDYEEMAKKTVVRRLCKMLPMSIELANAVSVDNAAESGEPIQIINPDVQNTIDTTAETIGEGTEVEATEASAPQSKSDALADQLSGAGEE